MFSGPQTGKKDSGILATTRGMNCMGKTSSAPMRPLSSEDGLGGDKEISSFVDSFISEIEAVEIFSWWTKPKAPSQVSRREEMLQPARAIFIFPKPSWF